MGYFKSYSLESNWRFKPSTSDAYAAQLQSHSSDINRASYKIFVEDKVTEDFVIKLEAYKSNKKFYNYSSTEVS